MSLNSWYNHAMVTIVERGKGFRPNIPPLEGVKPYSEEDRVMDFAALRDGERSNAEDKYSKTHIAAGISQHIVRFKKDTGTDDNANDHGHCSE